MFVTTHTRDGRSSNIADYNSLVQDRAGATGHTNIQTYKTGFRALASTTTVDARDNTCTTGAGVAIYWLNGSKVADNNADLYDGSWDSVSGRRFESGGEHSQFGHSSGQDRTPTEQRTRAARSG